MTAAIQAKDDANHLPDQLMVEIDAKSCDEAKHSFHKKQSAWIYRILEAFPGWSPSRGTGWTRSCNIPGSVMKATGRDLAEIMPGDGARQEAR